MKVGFANAAAAYTNAAQKIGTPTLPGTAGSQATAGGNFADMVQGATQSAIDSVQSGEAASVTAAAGKADLSDVVTAVTNAEVTLQTVVAVRDRVIQAYQEILRMPI
jgi:flagellar hook-basal body complex protein FliE